ncbi:hypothetical protein [Tenacibaculum finnmarkense]|uniref:Uncharacterized protein n=1 Tax=Tenacibaculum finnmarkense genomovar finnmarkense TaxID=1458503 RepID=A0AAP1WHB1_9FLAO|nr:hypothetical protein [Tenacibaculum finnmarkense]MBE7653915.1 hypothetical protein [Tenacibaculum finnmarkense genomovar finnmarkense]MBE7696217.1 hypothetical protein [Tenacibaculum finnmarkense genomovar finnmarkense]MCD8428461.1 hypothetical protein [Tenacibaculum finnmarkense genomovar finnmarkense]MCG8732229.1 hypothetical protein [Tenacibaculum finnmarkense]MCG8752896.1 hypothetical protein [Tenacibaculum finnmarkense]
MPVGIAKIAPRDTNLQADNNLVIIPTNESLSFSAYVYESTTAVQRKNIKWIWVEEKYLSQLRSMTKENKFEHWGKWSLKGKKPLNLYGIGINYAKSTSINISNLSGSIGKKYWLEAFVLYPEFKHPVGKCFTIKGKPAILSAYFEGAAIGECNDLVKSKYGKTINLIINTHSLPDVTLSYHNYVVFEIDIYNKEKNKKVTKEPFRSYVDFAQGAKDLNGTIKTGIILEDSWRNEVAHNNSDETKSYYAVIKATHYFNKDAVYNGEEIPGSKIGSAFVQKSPNKELVAYTITEEDWRKDNTYLSFLGKSFGDVKAAAAKYQSTEINFKTIDSKGEQLPLYVQLPYTTQGEAIGFRTIEAGKMLAAIKDKKYTCKETHSCKFTAIEVVVGENKDGKKTPTVIFNENDDSTIEVNDNTTKIFSFVAGESKRETLEITLKDLSITDYGNDDGEIKCVAPVPHTKKNLIDATKVSPQWLVEKGSATDKKYSTYEVKKNTILLDMGYHYNTKVAERSGINNKLLDKLWMFNYFLLSKKNAQDYVVPINTCRYPSQRVLLQVFPNITWGISFSVGKIDPKYKEDWRSDLTETRKKTLDEVKAFGEIAKPDFLKKKEQAIRKLNLKLGINVAYDNIKFDFAPDFGQKIHDVVYAFAKAKELMDVMTGNEYDDKTKKLKYQERIKKLAKDRGGKWASKLKLSKLPITITVSEPALSFGGTWGFQPNQLDATNVLPSYNIFFKAAPLLKASGKLNLITCAGFIPVADIILDAAGAEASFFIEVVGNIDVGVAFSMQVAAQAQLSKGTTDFDGALKMRVEASLTLGGGLVGFLFIGGSLSSDSSTKYVASVETGFTGGLKIGADNAGLYIDTIIKFAGLSATAQKVHKNVEGGGERTKTIGPYVIAKEITLLKNKHYFNLQKNDKA